MMLRPSTPTILVLLVPLVTIALAHPRLSRDFQLHAREDTVYAKVYTDNDCQQGETSITAANLKSFTSTVTGCGNLGDKYKSVKFWRSDGAYSAKADCADRKPTSGIGQCDKVANQQPIESVYFSV